MFKSISDQLEKETYAHRSQILTLERQIRCIDDLRSEADLVSMAKEADLETLANA